MRRSHFIAATWAAVAAGMAFRASPETVEQHRADVERKSRIVMPFDLDRTMHVFTPGTRGGTQIVRVRRDDPGQTALVRSHLKKVAADFAAGNFRDPTTIHGDSMPGVRQIRRGSKHIDVRYSEIPNGGRITYTTADPVLVAALHRWFAAQVSDHGHHATMKM